MLTPPAIQHSPAQTVRTPILGPIIRFAIFFAVITGFVEAAGLLWFQRINWANWGEIEHVSAPIFWISPVVDLALFLLIAFAIALAARFVPRMSALRVAVFVFSGLMFYDWLTVPGRFLHRSTLILALGLATVAFRIFRKSEATVTRVLSSAPIWCLVAVGVAWAGISSAHWAAERSATQKLPAAQTSATNVVVIVVDTLRADHLSAYGYARNTSPNIDRIAKQGVLFENAISASSWTLPSHASLLTGRYTYEHGATDVKQGGTALNEHYPSLAEVFANHGYRTGAFSANYLYFSRDLGFGRGFVHFEDYFHSSLDDFSRTLYGREIDRLVLSRELVRRLIIHLGFPSIDELQHKSQGNWMVRKRASEVNREALAWIDRDRTRPFFVFMNYFDVHRPYGLPAGYSGRFSHLSSHGAYVNESAHLTASVPQEKIDLCDDGVAYTDDQIKNLFDELKQRGLEQRTLVVITSDHGDLLGEHGLYSHRNTLYMPLIHVPFIFWKPGAIPEGVRVSPPVSNVSLAATLTDFLDMPEAAEFPGPSVRKLWTAANSLPDWPHPLSELSRFKDESPAYPSHFGAMTSLVTPQYHYVFHQTQGTDLYDWIRDPGENSDLSDLPSGKPIADALATEVRNRMEQSR